MRSGFILALDKNARFCWHEPIKAKKKGRFHRKREKYGEVWGAGGKVIACCIVSRREWETRTNDCG